MLPAACAGAGKTGRDFSRFEMCAMPLVATAADRAALAARVEGVRARLAFYASTPAYLRAFEALGYGEVAKKLQGCARAQRWDEMPALVDDEMLDAYAVIGTYDEIAAKLRARYAAVAQRLDFAIPAATAAEQALLRDLVAALRRD